MTKTVIRCTRCGRKYKTVHPEIIIRFCKACGQETEFEPVIKNPVTLKGVPYDIMCLRCRTVRHVLTIPKTCRCGQRFQNHAENSTLTDVLYNFFVGSDKEKGYMRVNVNPFDGSVWWTPPKDEYGDDIDPLIGDSKRTGHYSHQGRIDSMRTDDLQPTPSTSKRFIRK